MKQSTVILVLALILAVAASFLAGCIVTQRKYIKSFKGADTVYVDKWIHDTVPEPYEVVKVETKIVPLPVHDTTEVHDTTNVRDSVLVEVPITEKSYASSNYYLTIRGFQPELVDIWVKQQEKIITVPYQKRWSFTVGPQLGVGYTPKGWQPYAGAGITFGYSF